MAFDQVDLQYFPQKAAATTPANGGLELVSPKIGVDPGTLQDCLNYEISYEAGYKLADGLLNFGGRSLHTVTRPICGSLTPADPSGPNLVFVSNSFDHIGGGFVGEDNPLVSGDFPLEFYLKYDSAPNTRLRADLVDGVFYVIHRNTSTDATTLFSYNPKTGQELSSVSVPSIDNDDIRGMVVDSEGNAYIIVTNSVRKVNSLGAEQWNTSISGFGLDLILQDNELYVFNHNNNLQSLDTSTGGVNWSSTDSGFPLGTSFTNRIDVDSDGYIYTPSSSERVKKIDPADQSIEWQYTMPETVQICIVEEDALLLGTNLRIRKILISNQSTVWENDSVDGSMMCLGSDGFLYSNTSGAVAKIDTSDGQVLWDASEYNPPVALEFSDTSLGLFVFGQATNSDLYVGGEYDAAVTSAPSEIIGRIKILSLSEDEVCYQVVKGTNEALMGPAEDIRVFPDSSNTEVYATISDREQKVYEDVQDFIDFYETLNMNLAAQSGGNCPGSGPVNVLFELDDKVYAARDDDSGNGSKLYTTTDLYQLDKEVEWEAVDMGKEIDFKEGRIKFETALGRIFLEDLPEEDQIQAGDVTELGSIFDSEKTNPNPWNSIGGQSNWTSMESLSEKNESYSRAAVNMGPYFPGSTAPLNSWRDSAKLKVTGFGATFPTTNLSIKGIEVTVKHKKEASVTDGLDPSDGQARTKAVKLLGVNASANNASATLLGETATTATFGSDSDTWGGDLAHDKVTAKDFGVELQYEVRRAGAGHLFSVSIDVDYIEVKVYYEEGTEQIFFWDGNDDVASGNIIHAFKNDGDYDTEDAEGIFTIYDLNNPEAIVEDLEIRNAANGAGAIMALTAGGAEDVYLPTSEEMEDNKSISQTIKANFYADEDQESIYGVTGAGPAFMFNGEYFVKIRAPIIPEKDRPRHIAEHAQHLILGYPSGSILVSVVGEPLNFEGVDGASEWGFGDVITGLIGLSGNALGVLCEASTHALMGNNIQNFTTQTISKHTGALEYSVANMGQPMYCDFRGISNIAATERYGDFSWGRLSHNVTKWLQPRLQRSDLHSPSLTKIKGAIPVRNKNQYRLFFRDGYILTMSMFGPAGDAPMFTRQHYGYQNRGSDPTNNLTFVPTVLSSSVLTDGRELSMVGTEDGNIYILDQGTGVTRSGGVSNYHAFMVFNPFNGGEPHLNMKYNEIIVHGQHSGGQELRFSSGTNYLEPESGTFDETRTMGSLSNPLEMDLIPDKVSAHLPNVTDGFSMKIESEADGNLPHIIQALTFRVMPLSDKNAAPRRR